MSKRSDADLLDDILVCVANIKKYIAGMAYEDFIADPKTQDATIRNIEVIGEAIKNVSNETKVKSSKTPWKAIAGTRDRLIHSYFGVNIDIVWQIATNDILDLENEIERIKNAGLQ